MGMKLKIALLTMVLASCTGQVRADVLDTGGRCWAIAEKQPDGTPIEICATSFPGLWAGLGGTQVRYIEITGYVTYAFGVPHVFASKDMYLYSAGRGGIRLHVAADEKDTFDRMVQKERPMTLGGLYLPGRESKGDRPLGTMDVMPGRFWLSILPDEKPPSMED